MNKLRMKIVIKPTIRGYVTNERGVTALEFALLSPVFLGITFMIFQLGLYELYSASLSYATQTVARQIWIGNVANTTNININTFVSTFVCPRLPPPMTCDRVVVDSKVLTTPYQGSGASTWWTLIDSPATQLLPTPTTNALSSFCIGRSGSMVALQLHYAMPTISFPFFTSPTTMFNGSPVIWIASTAAFRNEPFGTAYTGC